MKGYNELRGQSFKLDYDAATKQFVSKPFSQSFLPLVASTVVRLKIAEIRARRKVQKSKALSLQHLAAMTPELRDDIGMTEIYALSQHA